MMLASMLCCYLPFSCMARVSQSRQADLESKGGTRCKKVFFAMADHAKRLASRIFSFLVVGNHQDPVFNSPHIGRRRRGRKSSYTDDASSSKKYRFQKRRRKTLHAQEHTHTRQYQSCLRGGSSPQGKKLLLLLPTTLLNYAAASGGGPIIFSLFEREAIGYGKSQREVPSTHYGLFPPRSPSVD